MLYAKAYYDVVVARMQEYGIHGKNSQPLLFYRSKYLCPATKVCFRK